VSEVDLPGPGAIASEDEAILNAIQDRDAGLSRTGRSRDRFDDDADHLGPEYRCQGRDGVPGRRGGPEAAAGIVAASGEGSDRIQVPLGESRVKRDLGPILTLQDSNGCDGAGVHDQRTRRRWGVSMV